MGTSFGIFTKGQKNVTFGNMKASMVDSASNPNNPDNPQSPNSPRADGRFTGFQNPLLGDDGKGKIGRWSQLNLDSLETVIDQIIEQYMRDKTWYTSVRCREALWNMYRRLEWWVKQQVDPGRGDYHRALQMIQDCINQILEEAQDPALAHNTSLPTCPAPYNMPYHGDYFNHYDGKDVEVKLFNTADLPLSPSFPGMFRYASSTEDQEWVVVHQVGGDESQGSEMIMKLPLDRLRYGNSSKITFNWRFKAKGYVRFQYLVSSPAGNGLNFFINNNQVGGEWSQMSGWQTATFNVSPGQTYKLDWMVRKQIGDEWGNNAVYIKNVECVEVIKSLDDQTPPDFTTLGNDAFKKADYEWITESSRSVVTTYFGGPVNHDPLTGNAARTLNRSIDEECDGTVSFSYRMARNTTPLPQDEWYLMYEEDFLKRSKFSQGHHGSNARSTIGPEWTVNGSSSETTANNALIRYDVLVGPDCTVDLSGTVELVCPDRQIDHYEPAVISDTDTAAWNMGGNIPWTAQGTPKHLRVDNPVQGSGTASTTVNLADDGWFTFTYDHSLRSTETFEVLVDGQSMLQTKSVSGQTLTLPLIKGIHTIQFRVTDTFTEQPFTDRISRDFTYNEGNAPGTTRGVTTTVQGLYGSQMSVTRNTDVNDTNAVAHPGDGIHYSLILNPGASWSYHEKVKLFTRLQDPSQATLIFAEEFNKYGGGFDPRISMTANWEWEDIVMRIHPEWEDGHTVQDGVYKVEGKDGSINTVTLSSVNLANDGFITFQYGGKFGPAENLEFYIDGQIAWTGAQSTQEDSDNNVTVPVPAGSHVFQWVYKDLGGTTTTPPPIDNSGSADYGETCYPSGNDLRHVDYNQAAGDVYTDRTSHIKWGGHDFYTSPTMHASEVDGGVITRDFYAPPFGSVDFAEHLTVLAGKGGVPASGWHSIDSSMSSQFFFSTPDGSYLLDVTGIYFKNEAYYSTDPFYTAGDINFSFKYLTYLIDKTGTIASEAPAYYKSRNLTGRDASYRAEFSVYLVPAGSTNYRAYRKLQVLENVGPRQDTYDTTSWSWVDAKTEKIITNIPAGNYQLVFGLLDTQWDTDDDAEGYAYYASVKDLKIQVSSAASVPDTSWDDTSVKVELINKATGAVIRTNTYNAKATGTGNATIQFNGLTPGVGYQVRYTLEQGTGTEGGQYGHGGSFAVSGSNFFENWGQYCKDANGNYYAKGNPPYPQPSDPANPPIYHEPDNSWCWVDAIHVYQGTNALCADSRVVATLFEEGTVTDTHIYAGTTEQDINYTITNGSDQVKVYDLTLQLDSVCGDGAVFRNGNFSLIDCLKPAPSYINVQDFQVVNNKPIWMGGCYPSNLYVRIYDEANTLVQSFAYTDPGLHSFSVTQLPHQPYSNYRVEIVTEQMGITSPVTGKTYLTKFRLLDFKVYENWVNVPDPFNGKLQFFIDGNLVDTFTNEGGFFTVSYPLPKGKHDLKWVFTEQGTGKNCWDFCEIDFLQVTNWICDSVRVVPYCDPGAGNVCIEELIKCLLKIWNDRPKACVIGKKIWLFT